MSQNEIGNYVRTAEDVKKVIEHAKLSENDLKPNVQPIYFGEKFENYKLLQLDEHILADLKCGQTVVFKGDHKESAVLCTKTKTYDVKEAETSNSILLLPELTFPDEEFNNMELTSRKVVGIFHTYLEVKPCKPRLTKLRHLLKNCSYKGSELEKEVLATSEMYTFEHLSAKIQASDNELKDALKEMGAFQIDGNWRVLDFEYECRALSFLLNLIDEQSWPYNTIPMDETLNILGELLPPVILQHIIDQYSTWCVSSNLSQTHRSLIEDKVCRFMAVGLLRPCDKFNLTDFKTAWQGSVPEGMITNLKQLDGTVLVDQSSHPQTICYFNEQDLPDDILERIVHLFQVRNKWTFNEIQPFLEKLSTDKLNVNTLLAKYTRATTDADGVRFYCSRYSSIM
ncbi:sister chromatid cohesion protein DCC1 [Acyrthosiphon pisum]|uniref:Sister chromatid cohesion protein DCC1 n=1 Tax=Acyrthosiphon pisum TaxID=7029 RepID=A0A8R2FA64_ACYPI|nr:sister chromatid cohesion protein DCC1 [Acyrthosiphon pisum]|eukprot:XP_008185811.1 PREDICTED: sister chromatid cohesion protein DCC1 [Acyrthosiphon pisum]